MSAYQIIQSDEFLAKLARQPNREAIEAVWAGIFEKIKKKPKHCGGNFYGRWAYPVLIYYIMAKIDDAAKTVTITDLVRLPL